MRQSLKDHLILLLLTAACLTIPFVLFGASETASNDAGLEINPEACNEIFKLPKGTIHMKADQTTMNPVVCSAYAFLITRYTPGSRSSIGLSNPKVEGIVKLNPDFAVALAKMLQNAPYMNIISAYRTPEGQGSKNPQSNHIYGCAVDLAYSQSNCYQNTCQWVLKNSGAYGLHIRMKYSPEWNHIEPIAKDACRSNGPGVGAPVASAPSSNLSDFARQLFGPNTPQPPTSDQNCTLSDGRVVPCSSIANQGNMTNPNNMSLGTPPQQSLPASQQPTQYMQPQTPAQGQPNSASQTLFTIPGQNVSSSTKSIALTLRELLDLYSATSTGVATTTPVVAVVIGGRDVATLQSNSSTSPVLFQVESVYFLSPPVGQTTFTSPGLQGNSLSSLTPLQYQPGTYQRVLADLKSVILRMLDYLISFGRPLPEGYGEYDEWAE